jgi:hypothetical protein
LQAKGARAREVAALCSDKIVAAKLRSYAADLDAEVAKLRARLDSGAATQSPSGPDGSAPFPVAAAALKPPSPDRPGEA